MIIRIDAELGPSALVIDPVLVTAEDSVFPNPFSQYPCGIMTIKPRSGDELLVGFVEKGMATEMLDRLSDTMAEGEDFDLPCKRWIYSGETANEWTEED